MKSFLQSFNDSIIVYKNYGTKNQSMLNINGLKTTENDKPDKAIFIFTENIGFEKGDVLQENGDSMLWLVTSCADFTQLKTKSLRHIEVRVKEYVPSTIQKDDTNQQS